MLTVVGVRGHDRRRGERDGCGSPMDPSETGMVLSEREIVTEYPELMKI